MEERVTVISGRNRTGPSTIQVAHGHIVGSNPVLVDMSHYSSQS